MTSAYHSENSSSFRMGPTGQGGRRISPLRWAADRSEETRPVPASAASRGPGEPVPAEEADPVSVEDRGRAPRADLLPLRRRGGRGLRGPREGRGRGRGGRRPRRDGPGVHPPGRAKVTPDDEGPQDDGDEDRDGHAEPREGVRPSDPEGDGVARSRPERVRDVDRDRRNGGVEVGNVPWDARGPEGAREEDARRA